MSIAAIQTHYAGCRFRSRLEARWAVFFDTLGIAWEYEPEGFATSSGPYLPDFRIQVPQVKRWGHHQWFEVKPDGSRLDLRHMNFAEEAGAVLIVARGLPRSYDDQWTGSASYPPPLTIYRSDTTGSAVAFCDSTSTSSRSYCTLGDNRHWCQEDVNNTLSDPGHLAFIEVCLGEHPPIGLQIDAAYTAARSARFEHGEQG